MCVCAHAIHSNKHYNTSVTDHCDKLNHHIYNCVLVATVKCSWTLTLLNIPSLKRDQCTILMFIDIESLTGTNLQTKRSEGE